MELNQNTWLSVCYKLKLKRQFELNSDMGFRFCSNFVNLNRQNFIRIIFDKKIKKYCLGVGYALFDTYNFKSKQFIIENRPFVQFKYEKKMNNIFFFSRFRSEIRFFKNQSAEIMRNRLQIGIEKKINQFVFPRISYEIFYSNLASNNSDQRFSIGDSISLKGINFFVFYTLQFQETVRCNNRQVSQHILGLQFQF